MAKKAVSKKIAQEEMAGHEMEDARSRFFEAARRVVLAGIGAVALAQDEAEDFVHRLVERGEIAEKDARKLIKEVTERRTKRAERELDRRVEDLLDKMNIPSKADIDALSAKITTLSHKIDDLRQSKKVVA